VIKAEFSASLLQSSVSHDPSEITLIFDAQKTFTIVINVENSCLLHIFVKTMMHLYLGLLVSDKYIKF